MYGPAELVPTHSGDSDSRCGRDLRRNCSWCLAGVGMEDADPAALLSGVLLLLFAVTMTGALGIKAPLDPLSFQQLPVLFFYPALLNILLASITSDKLRMERPN